MRQSHRDVPYTSSPEADTYMLHFGIPKEVKEVTSWHELHDDEHRVVFHTHSQNFDNVWVVEIANEIGKKVGECT